MKKLFGESAFDEIYKSSSIKSAKNTFAQDGYSNSELLTEGLNHVIKSEASVSMESYQTFQPEYKMQGTIRKYFGKNGVNYNTIAAHPDFKHLDKNEEYIKQYICTMFIDIKGSTTLSLKYELEFVHQFKNAVIQACIECIRAFDGYVHRIMGDAVLGFFGSKAISKEQAILDCMNCASVLNVFLVQNIQPWLRKIKPDFQDDNDFGFRIGCNFGDDDEVLWANYGFGATGEISPTGFSVDLAAKLQGLSGKNKAMIGQGLLEFINWPKDFTNIKVITKGGVEIQKPYVTPNYTKNKIPINYLMRELNQSIYLRGLPLPTDIKKSLTSGISHCSQITLENILRIKGRTPQPFISSSTIAPIGASIDFKVKILNDSTLLFPLIVKFKKINNEGFGDNQQEVLDSLNQDDSEEFIIKYDASRITHIQVHEASISRDCMYRGIHMMICEVRNFESQVIFREIVHVPIA
ncbi:adenylate/guanylate cyclase domain-containing protein [Acinetobacter nosocomialis]|uniref:adenylate/guanylate cyclase domain-containing protein n=1 Tax=Acinetobacter calcoaceticus/baumannii complex TaxID=909768 RepID=UPI000445EBE9|nr:MULTISPECIES: adenylate/guanylate cyclase domain-containing protein [Acinetobacter calcoaceticus/baumannii complex]EXH20852.1 adenylate and Guanylate cyclase catalytic domain protein [Acinetobacter sp. 1245249]MBR7723640.1 adenylate/guanylate cyclase domain-containing protein [Acinetobacter nosocomialis]MDO7206848.1 adenylate/guanylate cyclase domain-containing protein [Acinetobacter nosocomialis]